MQSILSKLPLLPLCSLILGNCCAETIVADGGNKPAAPPTIPATPAAPATKPENNKQPADAAATPAKQQNLRDWFEGKIIDCSGNDSTIKDNKYVALYFSAVWCGPCRGFTPKLVTWYNGLSPAQRKNIEVVFFSYDRDAEMMNNYMEMDKMPWKAVKFADRNTMPYQNTIGGIPAMIIIDEQGKIVAQGDPRKLTDKLKELAGE